jgi:hypothetical protein
VVGFLDRSCIFRSHERVLVVVRTFVKQDLHRVVNVCVWKYFLKRIENIIILDSYSSLRIRAVAMNELPF